MPDYMNESIEDKIKMNVPLAPFTTIHIGGSAKYFISCKSVRDLKDAISYARKNALRIHILGGGSNTIFADDDLNALVIKMDLKGIEFEASGKYITAKLKAGEDWDNFVKICVEKGLAGTECLSGIPGSAGATPMQNVGAYGQSVGDTILIVRALDLKTLKTVDFSNKECMFGYRSSRFKHDDAGKYVITEVVFRLQPNGSPTVKYPELLAVIQKDAGKADIGQGRQALNKVRSAVLKLRKKKSMVIDPDDPNSRSCGSFFQNPIITKDELGELEKKVPGKVPFFPEDDRHVKVPAGWLIEKCGISKGYRQGNVGVSPNHTLALVNYGGTALELLKLAEYIKMKVKSKFGLELRREPVLVE